MEALINIACTIGGILLCYLAFFRNTKKDSQEEGKANGTMLSELGYIKANTDDIKTEQREQRKTNIELFSRITAVESSAKQAHKRLDTIEGRIDT